MDGKNTNNMNASNTISTQYSQLGSFLDSLSEAKAKEKGKKIAKALQDGLEQGLKGLPSIGKELAKTTKDVEASLEAIKQKSGKAFSPETTKLQNNYLKEANNLLKNQANLKTAIEKEAKKAVPDQQKVVELYKKLVEHEERACFLQDTASQQIALIQAKEHERVLLNEKIKLLNEDQTKANKKALADIEKKIEAEQTNIQQIQNDISSVGENLKDNTEGVKTALDDVNKEGTKFLDNVNEGLKKTKDAIGSIQGSLTSIMSAISIDKAINDWDTQLSQYTKRSITMGNRWGTGYSHSDEFNNMKNSFIDALGSDKVGYSLDQIYSTMDEMASYQFDNYQEAVNMASDLAFAKEYMGQTSASLHAMYSLQVRTNQDDFLKKSLNVIASLQRAGNALTQEQMDQASQSSMTLTEKLMDMGMSGDMADEAYSGMMAYATAMEKTTGREGDAQKVLDMFDRSLSLDNLGQMVSSPQAYLNAINAGEFDKVFNMLLSGPSAKAADKNRQNGISLAGITMGSEDVFGGYNNNELRRFTEAADSDKFQSNLQDNLSKIASGSNALDEMKDKVSDDIPKAVKDMQKNAQALAETNWGAIASQLAYEEEVKTVLGRIVDKIDALIGVVAIGQALGGIFKKGSSLLSKGKSLGGSILNKVGHLGGASGSIGDTIVNGVGVTAGLASIGTMAYDGLSAGFQGYTDSDGNRIKGSGGGYTGLVSAVTNQNLYATRAQDAGSTALKGAGLGAMIGTFIGGPFGTAIGGAIGAAAGGIVGAITHNAKEAKKASLKTQKQNDEAIAFARATAQNTEAIKNARDVVLSNRYDDNRYSYSTASTGSAPSNYGIGGEFNGVDIDGWSRTSGYGYRGSLNTSTGASNPFHSGIDFAGKSFGSPVGAATSGKVTRAITGHTWDDGTGKANYVDIYNEANGLTYRYYHLSGAAVQEGQQISAGQTIGYVGNTGSVYPAPTKSNPHAGTHLHFSVLKNGSYIDPAAYVTSSIFHPGESGSGIESSSSQASDWVTSTSAFKLNSKSSRDAQAYSMSAIPNFQASGSDNGERPIIPMNDNQSIIDGLNRINNTLIAIDKRQSDQQKILDALTKSPIQDLGV